MIMHHLPLGLLRISTLSYFTYIFFLRSPTAIFFTEIQRVTLFKSGKSYVLEVTLSHPQCGWFPLTI